MTRIILAIDDDEARARSSAEAIAALEWDMDSISVSVLHVFEDNPEGAAVSQVGAARTARDVLEAEGIEVELAETSGAPTEQILKFVEDEDADAIALAGRDRTPAGKAVFGSVSQSVMLKSDVPVLFCPSLDD